MSLKQFPLERLGHVSKFIGSYETGAAFVLDIQRFRMPLKQTWGSRRSLTSCGNHVLEALRKILSSLIIEIYQPI